MNGPSFALDRLSTLTDRVGFGPLWAVWDTNILSMYEQYGLAMWEGGDLDVKGHDKVEVAALGDIISMWMWWDIRFVVMPDTATDSRRPRPAEAVHRRTVSMAGLAAALELGLGGEDEDGPTLRAGGLTVATRESLPSGPDRNLVDAAYRLGADVFITTDKRVLRRNTDTTREGMRIVSPSGLRDRLVEAGISPGWAPAQLQGLAPDLGRMAALLEALGV